MNEQTEEYEISLFSSLNQKLNSHMNFVSLYNGVLSLYIRWMKYMYNIDLYCTENKN